MPVSERNLFASYTDCSRICPGKGKLFNCSVCVCNDTKVTGLVADIDGGSPLADADIFVVERQWTPFATSDVNGAFTLEKICLEGNAFHNVC